MLVECNRKNECGKKCRHREHTTPHEYIHNACYACWHYIKGGKYAGEAKCIPIMLELIKKLED